MALRAAVIGKGKGPMKPQPEWKPLLISSPVPDHPSTHTVLGWAAARC
jgi:hypothetical protein